MALVDYDAVAGTLTVKRGVADTVPAAHAAAATVWTIDDDLVWDGRNYSLGETAEAFFLTATRSDVLRPDETTVQSLALVGRQAKPYPPGNVKVDGTPILNVFPQNQAGHAEPVLTWAHRDRILQDDQLVGHTEASVGPEDGTTYTVRVYHKDTPNVVLATYSGIVGDTWTYDAVKQLADGSPGAVHFEVESSREGLTSYQKYRSGVIWLNSGYGYGYGFNYGGKA
jgi:hypothetical protein